jgi:deoxyadenosine/deoxycytidine kinase
MMIPGQYLLNKMPSGRELLILAFAAQLLGLVKAPSAVIAVCAALGLWFFKLVENPLTKACAIYALASILLAPLTILYTVIGSVFLAAAAFYAKDLRHDRMLPRSLLSLLGYDGGSWPFMPQPSPPKTPRTIVILEGSICAGKTTILKKYSEAHANSPPSATYYEYVNQHLLKLFYKDMPRYCFTLEVVSMEMRANTLDRAYADRNHDSVIDRSMFGGACFAAWNYVLGNLSAAEYAMYTQTFEEKFRIFLHGCKLKGIKLKVVHVQTSSRICLERLRERVGVDTHIDERYVLGLAIMHAIILPHLAKTYACAELELFAHEALSHTNIEPAKWTRSTNERCVRDRASAAIVQLSELELVRLRSLDFPAGTPLKLGVDVVGVNPIGHYIDEYEAYTALDDSLEK